MTAESGPVSVQYPPMFSDKPFVVTCSKCPDFRVERRDEHNAWASADAHNRSHRGRITTTELHVCATCDKLVPADHPAEWLLSDGTWTHDETNPDIIR